MEVQTDRPSRPGTTIVVLTLTLIVNNAYLAAYGDPNLLYVANSLIHPLLGITIAVLFSRYLLRHRGEWRAVAGKGAIVLLALGAIFGFYLAFVGMIRPNSWALYAHVSLTIRTLSVAH